MKNNFIFFGCWNDGYCDINKPDNNGVSSVFHHLLNAPNPTFYVVGGDNYYPGKYEFKHNGIKTKIKLLNEENFHSGMNCLKMLNTKADVFLLMGNHDLQEENTFVNINKYNIKSKDFDPSSYKSILLNSCKIMELQSAYKPFFNYERFGRLLGKDTLLLFINSMFYTEARNDIFKCFQLYRYSERYQKFKDKIENLIAYEEAIINFFCHIIKERYPIHNIIIIGHEPILSRRIKDKEEIATSLENPGLRFLSHIYDIFSDCNKYYLCANVHQYQEIDIQLDNKHNIKQYVVGTGGTKCDDKICPPKDVSYQESLIKNEEIKLLFKLNRCERAFGYLDITNNQGELIFNFIKTGECELYKKQ